MTDIRQQLLSEWVADTLAKLTGGSAGEARLESVSGDASFRRYFRTVVNERSFIAVDAPPDNEDSATFVRLSNLFRDAGVCAPKVFAEDFEQGFMLLDDFGDQLLLPALREARARKDFDTVDAHYREAIRVMLDIQQKVDGGRLGPYDRKALRREMDLFPQWFCEKFLEVSTEPHQGLIDSTFKLLEDSALAQPQVPVHRDYHSRNLMLLNPDDYEGKHRLGVIDFQDAVVGACSYDLVSLLRDCYIRWEDSRLQGWLEHYLERAQARGLLAETSPAQLRRDFDLMGLQRHIKVMGIFARLAIRDKKPRYLADIPLVIHYFLDVAAGYPELADFLQWFREELLPRAGKKLNQEF